ncbi:MAG TPA: thermonuclease family protein [Pseudolabrys sp.]|nr:thermonuclease family protein [Pseudolabrys sp.]
MTRGWYRAVAAALALPACAAAQETCHLETIGTAKVAGVRDGRTFTLADGRVVRLAGLQVPRAARGQVHAQAAKDALAALISGQTITLKRAGSAPDRYGRLRTFAFAENNPGQSLNAALLAKGLARALPDDAIEGCAKPLLAAEAKARAGSLGFWADPAFAPLPAGDRARILALRGAFALVQGKVLSVHEAGTATYVNFGRHWSRDFSVVILRRNQRTFSAAGVEPKALDHHRIRVRGIVEQRGGPIIEADYPEQIEITDEQARVTP